MMCNHRYLLTWNEPVGHQDRWEHAMPLGNGRMGALVFGTPAWECLVLNEDSIWSRSPDRKRNPTAQLQLQRLRELLARGEAEEAEFLAEQTFMGIPSRVEPYQPLSAVLIKPGPETHRTYSNYQRSLDLDTGIARIEYGSRGRRVVREVFVSCPDQLLAMRWTVQGPPLSLMAHWDRQESGQSTPLSDRTLAFHGQAGSHGTRFCGCMEIARTDGDSTVEGCRLTVKEATTVEFRISASTDYRHPHPQAAAQQALLDAAGFSWEELKERHVRDHRKLFQRVQFRLSSPSAEPKTVPEQLQAVRSGEVPAPGTSQ